MTRRRVRQITPVAWTALALFLLLVAAAVPAAAQTPSGPPDDEPGAGPGGFGPGPGPGGPDFEWWTSPRLKAQLGPTAEQEKTIQSIMFSSGEKMIDLRAAVDKARLEMTRVLAADAIDDAAAKKAIERLVDAECQGARLRHTARIDVAKVLTRDQRLQLMQLMEKRLRERPRGERPRAR
jgi:Spy/CpxP family protein refolding chaperone